jgi:hypothetical protein
MENVSWNIVDIRWTMTLRTADAQLCKQPRHCDFVHTYSYWQTCITFSKDVLRPSNENCSIAQSWIRLSLRKAAAWKIHSFTQNLQYYADVKTVRKILENLETSEKARRRLIVILNTDGFIWLRFHLWHVHYVALHYMWGIALHEPSSEDSLWNTFAILITVRERS